MSTWLKQHPLVAYFTLAYAISWAIAVPLGLAALAGHDAPFALHYLVSYGPLLAAIIVTALTTGKAGLRDLGSRMTKYRVPLLYWLFAISPILLYLLVVPIIRLTDGAWPNFALLGSVHFLPMLNIFVALLLWLFTFGIGEETGWRGFALPHLQQRYNPLVASLILFVLWAGWHIPQFFYINNPNIIGWSLGLLAGAFLLTWLYNGSGGSILLAAVWHGTFNFITASEAGSGLVAAVLSTVVMAAALLYLFIAKRIPTLPANQPSQQTANLSPSLSQRA